MLIFLLILSQRAKFNLRINFDIKVIFLPLNSFFCFRCNNVIVLRLIIFSLIETNSRMCIHIIYFEITQHSAELLTIINVSQKISTQARADDTHDFSVWSLKPAKDQVELI
jgi:hypothetical protein